MRSSYPETRIVVSGRFWLLAALALVLWPRPAAAEEPPTLPRGHVYLSEDFEGEAPGRPWGGTLRFADGYKSKRSLAIERVGEGSPSATVHIALPAAEMRGYRIQATAFVKAEGVSAKPNSWNGIKFMAAIEAPGGRQWPQADVGTGTFDWKRLAFSARIPPDATAVTLYLGLE